MNLYDAAHLHSKYKGTIYIYSGLTRSNKIFAMGKEDYATWTLFNNLFSQSCPSVSHVEESQKYSNLFSSWIVRRDWNDHYVRFSNELGNQLCPSHKTKHFYEIWKISGWIHFPIGKVILHCDGRRVPSENTCKKEGSN